MFFSQIDNCSKSNCEILIVMEATSEQFTTFRHNKICAGHFGATLSTQVKIGTDHSQHRKDKELTLLYLALIKENLYAKLIVLLLIVTCYIGNMIAFFCCHYAYLSITITSKLSALNCNN